MTSSGGWYNYHSKLTARLRVGFYKIQSKGFLKKNTIGKRSQCLNSTSHTSLSKHAKINLPPLPSKLLISYQKCFIPVLLPLRLPHRVWTSPHTLSRKNTWRDWKNRDAVRYYGDLEAWDCNRSSKNSWCMTTKAQNNPRRKAWKHSH